jgi:tetratricopeptide (TPR) repeat protein
MEPVLYHNQEDILSLLGVVIMGGSFFVEEKEESLEDVADALDLFGAAKVLEKTGEVDKSVVFIRRALEGKLSEEISLLAKKKLAHYFKRNQEWEKAVSLWQEMTPQNQLFCFRELAMYYEHKEKDYHKAKEISEEGLALAMGISRTYEADFAHRMERLRARITRQKKGAKT